jgi:hypothetical protein
MPLDPRLLTTPMGAVIGLALARKVLRPEDRTPYNLTVGAGLGGGAGLLAGQFIKGELGESKLRTGAAPPSEVAELDRRMSASGGVHGRASTPGLGPIARTRYHLSNRVYGSVEQQKAHAARAQDARRESRNPNISPRRKELLLSAATKNEDLSGQHGSDITRGAVFGKGQLAMFDTLKDYISSILGLG